MSSRPVSSTRMMFYAPFGSPFASKPIVLGHEGAGIVEAVGLAVGELEIGDHVVLSGDSCGQCPGCHVGHGLMRSHGPALLERRTTGQFVTDQPVRRGDCRFVLRPVLLRHLCHHVGAHGREVPRNVPLHLLGPLGCGMITGAASVLEALRVPPGQSIAMFGRGGGHAGGHGRAYRRRGAGRCCRYRRGSPRLRAITRRDRCGAFQRRAVSAAPANR